MHAEKNKNELYPNGDIRIAKIINSEQLESVISCN